jgi:DNA-binding transcriptional MocR family regulator
MGVSAAISAIEQAGWEVIEWDYDNQGMQVN